MTSMSDVRNPETPWWARLVGWLGLVLHLALLYWYAASGLLAPGWAVVTLLVIWAALLVVALRLRRSRPLLTPVVPLVGFVVWVAAITAGENWLGWTP